jgi:bacterioferritin-associated ferredoxin
MAKIIGVAEVCSLCREARWYVMRVNEEGEEVRFERPADWEFREVEFSPVPEIEWRAITLCPECKGVSAAEVCAAVEARFAKRKEGQEEAGCHNCARNVGAGCFATQQHPHDAGYGQPYCDGYEKRDG